MHVAALQVELMLPGCMSLKDKRSRLKPLLAALHREFNVSAAEIDQHDAHTVALVACVGVSTDVAHLERWLGKIPAWIESRRPDLQVIDHNLTHL
jgi:uncharacterized protein YlxP (DUF503 family)